MYYKRNLDRINELDKQLAKINSVSSDSIGYYFYLENKCELNLRKILKKYYDGENLSKDDEELIIWYDYLHTHWRSLSMTSSEIFILKYTYASGEFDMVEKKMLDIIATTIKERTQSHSKTLNKMRIWK